MKEKDFNPQDENQRNATEEEVAAQTPETALESGEKPSAARNGDEDRELEETAEASALSPLGSAVSGAAAEEERERAPKKSGASLGWMIVSLVLAILLVVVLIKPPFGGSGNETVATVNGEKITQDQLYDSLVKSGGKNTLDSLITEKLVDQEAKKQNVTVTQADLDSELQEIKKQFGTEEQFNAALQQYGMTLDDLKSQMKAQVQIRKILLPKTNVTDEQIKQYFEENKQSFNTAEQVEASHILVATEQEADAIIKQLNGGADFAAIAKEKSTDPGSKDNGGALGYFGKGAMDPAFEEAAFKLKVGETSSEPVKSSFGYHIIKVTGHKEAHTATLDEQKETIKKTLQDQAIQSMSASWMADLKSKATITNTLDNADEGAAAPGSTDTGAPAAPEAEGTK
ncbi:peptidylprolyl isomerase [Paenibacillus beijingensis]|uniref:Foldase protein PrsA n=1 Tax=Paenibacillus beijingensis TaxID=1126833 RepID=A0A0D5NH69_9BACL|nr:peptidylprolyl isomerase [Paenibacillus beijingensis]AJY74485.1 hypothetical protein VN24_07740 [Paenibacillus beijingensis]